MFTGSDNIEGIEALKKGLPAELQHWHILGNHVEELHYRHILNDECSDIICCMEMILTDPQYKYSVKLFLYNVIGEISLDMVNGFWSGLAIDDLSDTGAEKHSRFHIYSFEQDIDFSLYCEKIKAELIKSAGG